MKAVIIPKLFELFFEIFVRCIHTHTHTEKEIYYEELAQLIIEAEESQDL